MGKGGTGSLAGIACTQQCSIRGTLWVGMASNPLLPGMHILGAAKPLAIKLTQRRRRLPGLLANLLDVLLLFMETSFLPEPAPAWA